MRKQKPNYWMVASIIILLLICLLSGYLIKDKIDSKPKSMQNFYNLGWNQGSVNLVNDLCDDGLITIQGQEIPLLKLCELS